MCLAIPGKVVSVDEGVGRIAKVEFGGITRTASLDLVPEAGVGDYVLVHVGFAISKIDEEEAHKTLEALQTLANLQDELEPEESDAAVKRS
ncbi:MAG TPA: HypC/HybG/HupF family hydrogenase formation chaperone [Terriglobales bacterium]|nr:HypC/HybG/HupF family hydrogenase formation chaperone [Terriglobales bacterium]